jgi:hypothetical protein
MLLFSLNREFGSFLKEIENRKGLRFAKSGKTFQNELNLLTRSDWVLRPVAGFFGRLVSIFFGLKVRNGA